MKFSQARASASNPLRRQVIAQYCVIFVVNYFRGFPKWTDRGWSRGYAEDLGLLNGEKLIRSNFIENEHGFLLVIYKE